MNTCAVCEQSFVGMDSNGRHPGCPERPPELVAVLNLGDSQVPSRSFTPAHETHVRDGTRSLYCPSCGTWPPTEEPLRALLHAKADLLTRDDDRAFKNQMVRLTEVHEIIDEAFEMMYSEPLKP